MSWWKAAGALHLLSVGLVALAVPRNELHGQFVELPPERESTWHMSNASELIALVTFDQMTIGHAIPQGLHLVTLSQLAPGDPKIREYLNENPAHHDYALGLVEIVRQDSFAIDARSPQWTDEGAVGVWFTLANADQAGEPRARGTSWLSLGFWMADSSFIADARETGWPFELGEAIYHQGADGTVAGEIRRPDLHVFGSCRPSPDRRPLIDPFANVQTIWFPRTELQRFALVTFEGHHERECESAHWSFSGEHPLGRANFIYSPGLQDGYDLLGGLYIRSPDALLPAPQGR